ncbi:MAG: STAS domain-containing protein [Nocardioidaceae bacterium]
MTSAEPIDGAHVITVEDHLDVRNVGDVRAKINVLLDRATGDVTLDCTDVELIDAAGLGMLTAAHLRAERSGHRLILRNCSKEIRRVLAVTHLNRVLHIDRGSLQLSA